MAVYVLTYNIHCVPLQCTVNHLQRVCAYLTATLDRLKQEGRRVAVVLLNEIFLKRAVQRLKATFRRRNQRRNQSHGEEQWKYLEPTAPGFITVGDGLACFWDSQLAQRSGVADRIVYTKACQMDRLSRKGCLAQKFQFAGGLVVDIFATHMQAWEVPVLCRGVRQSQREELHNFVQQRGSAYYAIIGDLNENDPKKLAFLGTVANCEGGACQTYGSQRYDYLISNMPDSTTDVLRDRGLQPTNPSDHCAVLCKLITS